MQKDCLERPETKIVSHNSWLKAIYRSQVKGNYFAGKYFKISWTITKVTPIEKSSAGYCTSRWWAKGSREAASEGPTVLNTCFLSLSYLSKWQLGAPAQKWQRYSMQTQMVDF